MNKPIDTGRRLVAIFAADVEGYSRLMEVDEVATLQDFKCANSGCSALNRLFIVVLAYYHAAQAAEGEDDRHHSYTARECGDGKGV